MSNCYVEVFVFFFFYIRFFTQKLSIYRGRLNGPGVWESNYGLAPAKGRTNDDTAMILVKRYTLRHFIKYNFRETSPSYYECIYLLYSKYSDTVDERFSYLSKAFFFFFISYYIIARVQKCFKYTVFIFYSLEILWQNM